MRKGLLILISGPSGTGKGTVCDLLRKNHPEISYSISATTRQPRPGEQDGVNYYFYDKEKFRQMIDAGELLEWAEVYGNYYGTPKQKVLDRLNAGEDILLEIDTQGALNVMKAVPEGLFIFLLPPSLEELAKAGRVVVVDTEQACRELGSGKIVNLLLLGVAAASGQLGLTVEDIRQAVRLKVPAKFHEMNFRALEYAEKLAK